MIDHLIVKTLYPPLKADWGEILAASSRDWDDSEHVNVEFLPGKSN